MGRTKSEINDLICKQVFMLALCVTKKMGKLGDGISCDVANIELMMAIYADAVFSVSL